MAFKKLALIFFILPYTQTLKAQTAAEVISGYIKFIGGKEKWKTIHTIITSGTYNYGGVEFPFTAYSKSPDRYKFVVPFNGKYYAQAFDGEKGWKIDAFKNQTKRTLLTGKPARAMANEADVELETPFIDYQEKGHTLLLEGRDTLAQTLCYRVKFTRKTGEVETYFFDIDSFKLVKKQAASKNEEMDNKRLDTFYGNYQEVNGIKIPFECVSKLGGQTILTIKIKEGETNVPIPDADFK